MSCQKTLHHWALSRRQVVLFVHLLPCSQPLISAPHHCQQDCCITTAPSALQKVHRKALQWSFDVKDGQTRDVDGDSGCCYLLELHPCNDKAGVDALQGTPHYLSSLLYSNTSSQHNYRPLMNGCLSTKLSATPTVARAVEFTWATLLCSQGELMVLCGLSLVYDSVTHDTLGIHLSDIRNVQIRFTDTPLGHPVLSLHAARTLLECWRQQIARQSSYCCYCGACPSRLLLLKGQDKSLQYCSNRYFTLNTCSTVNN